MADVYPDLQQYSGHWVTVRLLQAHLKTRAASQKQFRNRDAVRAIASVVNSGATQPLTRTRTRQVRSSFFVLWVKFSRFSRLDTLAYYS